MPGAEADYAKAVMKPETGGADFVVIEGLKIANATKETGGAIVVIGRKGVVLRSIEAVNSRFGVLFNASKDCQLLNSHVHHCDNPVYVQAPCVGIMIADNHVHHPRKFDCINL